MTTRIPVEHTDIASTAHPAIRRPRGESGRSTSVAGRMAAAAETYGDAVALRTADAGTTEGIGYRTLLDRARRICSAIDSTTAPGDQPVVVQVAMSGDAVAVVLGVFLSRRPIVAMDPALPAERVRVILDQLRRHGRPPAMIIADDAHLAVARQAADDTLEIRRVDELSTDAANSVARAAASRAHDESHAVTSIQFTSGSTGTPKGVLHPNAMWLCDADLMNGPFGIGPGRRVALCLPISFGAGLNVLIGSLLNGAEVTAIDPRSTSPEQLLDQMSDAGATIAFMTPSLLRALSGISGRDHRAWTGLGRVITTGEALPGDVARAALDRSPHLTVTNWVGSSETSALAYFDVRQGDTIPAGILPAGHAAPEKLIDIDTDGRIVVSSPYLALGYLDPTSDTGHFERDSLGRSIFRMSDRGELAEGILHLRGRADNAVKIRGYLVEPAEIERALLADGDIAEVVVIAQQTGTAADTANAAADEAPEPPAGRSAPTAPDATLVAYVVPNGRVRTPAPSELRTRLHETLPPWMVPATIVELSELPRTARGKVDRAALPAPRRVIEQPRGHLEAAIAHIWARELHLDTIGRTENIYALGADSLTVQQILVQITEQLGVALTQSEAAGAPTVAEMAVAASAHRSGPRRRPRGGLAPTTIRLRAAEGRTVFCYTGAGASALAFVPLADHLSHLDAIGSVHAFQPHGLDNRGLPDWTIDRAVRRHLRDLRRLQPSGPYVLVGHSLGGFLALETARRLRAAGEQVDMVVVLDTFVPPRVTGAVRDSTPDLTVTPDEAPLPRAELWRRRARLPLAGIVPMSPVAAAGAMEEVGRRVGLLHRPRPYDGRVLLVQGSENHDDPRIWSEHITTGDLTVRRLDCDHMSIIRAPHITEVIDAMSESLDLH
ncbi:alpha/beta fold hydrolase [Gordonia sp. ABSL11-1]|uniref:alpha/beta fold hydrolase n=1 Tax=Gordonia sp. ABSL11-1 TaxID=3053924 RepID=UPI00257298CA|nr:alpha/beta fold hydrolase [Gordonia sp. ABSL11-1]MDL9945561.1 alpha/beta fold hydrolase [Gordonia sp. ABSL11-1]